jgi:hypothetical protein
MFFFRHGSNFCTPQTSRIAQSCKDFWSGAQALFINLLPSIQVGFSAPLRSGFRRQKSVSAYVRI